MSEEDNSKHRLELSFAIQMIEKLPVSVLLLSDKNILLYMNELCKTEFGFTLDIHENVYDNLNMVCNEFINSQSQSQSQKYFEIGAKYYTYTLKTLEDTNNNIKYTMMCITDNTAINKKLTNALKIANVVSVSLEENDEK